MQNKSKNQGLTLVEVAIVLVILGLLIGLGASLIGPLTKRAKITETKDTLNAAVESVIGFGVKNNRIPTNEEFPQAVRNSNDAWTKPLIYFFDPTLTATPNNPAEGICGRKTTNLIVCTDADCRSQIQDVAFIVVSGGPNYNVQTGSLTTSPCPSGKTCYKVYPQDYPNVDDYPPDLPEGARAEEYDDIVKWITLDELRIKVGCQGAQLKILNNELPYGYVGSTYNATIYAEGGVPFTSGGKYKWCVFQDKDLDSTKKFNDTDIRIYLGNSSYTLNVLYDSDSQCDDFHPTNWYNADFLKLDTNSVNIRSFSDGTYHLTFYVKDDGNNTAQKTLVLTIHPQTSSGSSGPSGAQVSFANNINQFQEVENNPNAVQVVGNTLILGGNIYSERGCFWFPSSYTLNNKKMRAYFKFRFTTVDTSSDSTAYADGFTFAVVDGNMPVTACGGLGVDIGFGGLNYDSVAVEFDTYPNGSGWRNDPAPNNHVAIIKRGNNTHGASTPMGNNPLCPSEGCYRTTSVTWLEDGVEHTVRVEIHTGCNPACNNCSSNPQNYSLIKAWIDCTSCNDLTQDYSASPTISHCFQLPSTMNSVKFGFTEGTGGRTQNIEIKDFGIGFY
ncbi:prepilin-type N-terminal cleavage/methylation domain-containing protein [Thermodesulfovibrio sp. 1176]|uniref:prepilin-type N-terminal cleavage/methylation domain-containing protein n=1 Tax=Thermodesulfovibrio sp. 1176 TaxID=3043424 RepID=UPI00248212D2|nr:prepilin-type N-terminal cleavage/methylation domain-containing protein [Thermodesulfovibrio sp. 1176]MDI1472825.1 prepilin-type N-terminal cleavage/methylation domain-containing protein [Thermodesulfovibrio sp. 1176]